MHFTASSPSLPCRRHPFSHAALDLLQPLEPRLLFTVIWDAHGGEIDLTFNQQTLSHDISNRNKIDYEIAAGTTLRIHGELTLKDARFVIDRGATLIFDTGTLTLGNNSHLDNYGSVIWNAGDLVVAPIPNKYSMTTEGTFSNHGPITWNDGQFISCPGYGGFVNFDVVNWNDGTMHYQASGWNTGFNNGTFNLNGGTLIVGGTSSSNRGILNLNAGTLEIEGTLSNGFDGTLNIKGGDVDIGLSNSGAYLSNWGTLNFELGTINVAGTLVNRGLMNLDGGTMTISGWFRNDNSDPWDDIYRSWGEIVAGVVNANGTNVTLPGEGYFLNYATVNWNRGDLTIGPQGFLYVETDVYWSEPFPASFNLAGGTVTVHDGGFLVNLIFFYDAATNASYGAGIGTFRLGGGKLVVEQGATAFPTGDMWGFDPGTGIKPGTYFAIPERDADPQPATGDAPDQPSSDSTVTLTPAPNAPTLTTAEILDAGAAIIRTAYLPDPDAPPDQVESIFISEEDAAERTV